MISKDDLDLLNDVCQIFGKLSFLPRFTVDTKHGKIQTKWKKDTYLKRFFLSFTLVFCTSVVFTFYAQSWKLVFGKKVRLDIDIILRNSSILASTLVTSGLLPTMYMLVLAPKVVANAINPFGEIFAIVKGKNIH